MRGAHAATGRLRGLCADPLIKNSSLMLATTAVMAVVGSIFWIVAAHVASQRDVGYASSLATTAEALSIFAQLGLNLTLIKTMSRSDRQRADIAVTIALVYGAGVVLGLGYAGLLPVISPELASVVSWPVLVPVFAVLVGGTAVNQLTDGVFLALNRVGSNLVVNGGLLSVLKLGLPLLFGAGGAFAVYGAVGGSAFAAAAASVVLVLRYSKGKIRSGVSSEFRDSRRFSGAGYLSSVLYFLPQLIFPLIIINERGAGANAIYFICFQIVTLINQGVYAISNSMYAEASRRPDQAVAVVAKAGRTLAGAAVLGVGLLIAVASPLLAVFGVGYAADGTWTLRVLAIGTLGVAFNYWSAVRLRIAHKLRAMVGVQLLSTVSMIGMGVLLAPFGIAAFACAWGLGQTVGGVVGWLLTRRDAQQDVLYSPAVAEHPLAVGD